MGRLGQSVLFSAQMPTQPEGDGLWHALSATVYWCNYYE